MKLRMLQSQACDTGVSVSDYYSVIYSLFPVQFHNYGFWLQKRPEHNGFKPLDFAPALRKRRFGPLATSFSSSG